MPEENGEKQLQASAVQTGLLHCRRNPVRFRPVDTGDIDVDYITERIMDIILEQRPYSHLEEEAVSSAIRRLYHTYQQNPAVGYPTVAGLCEAVAEQGSHGLDELAALLRRLAKEPNGKDIALVSFQKIQQLLR